MKFVIITPTKGNVVRKGIPVVVAPNGMSWSELSLGLSRTGVGVYVIHHDKVVKYVGKTSGRTMNFGIRLRRHFQQSAAGDHTYPRLAKIVTPPQIEVSLYDLEKISSLVSYKGKKLMSSRSEIIQLFEAALIIALEPEFQ